MEEEITVETICNALREMFSGAEFRLVRTTQVVIDRQSKKHPHRENIEEVEIIVACPIPIRITVGYGDRAKGERPIQINSVFKFEDGAPKAQIARDSREDCNV